MKTIWTIIWILVLIPKLLLGVVNYVINKLCDFINTTNDVATNLTISCAEKSWTPIIFGPIIEKQVQKDIERAIRVYHNKNK